VRTGLPLDCRVETRDLLDAKKLLEEIGRFELNDASSSRPTAQIAD
jgi:hypothetical protein